MTEQELKQHEHLLGSANNARLIHLNESIIFPLLHTKVEERLASLCEAFKGKGEVKLADVAYIAAVRDIITELNSKARHGDKATVTLNLNSPVTGE